MIVVVVVAELLLVAELLFIVAGVQVVEGEMEVLIDAVVKVVSLLLFLKRQ